MITTRKDTTQVDCDDLTELMRDYANVTSTIKSFLRSYGGRTEEEISDLMQNVLELGMDEDCIKTVTRFENDANQTNQT